MASPMYCPGTNYTGPHDFQEMERLPANSFGKQQVIVWCRHCGRYEKRVLGGVMLAAYDPRPVEKDKSWDNKA